MWWSCPGLHRTEVFVSHRNARLTVHGRRLLVERAGVSPRVALRLRPGAGMDRRLHGSGRCR
ncbi:hypothetical protein AB0B37_35340 [Streptomyces olivaceoviridis]